MWEGVVKSRANQLGLLGNAIPVLVVAAEGQTIATWLESRLAPGVRDGPRQKPRCRNSISCQRSSIVPPVFCQCCLASKSWDPREPEHLRLVDLIQPGLDPRVKPSNTALSCGSLSVTIDHHYTLESQSGQACVDGCRTPEGNRSLSSPLSFPPHLPALHADRP